MLLSVCVLLCVAAGTAGTEPAGTAGTGTAGDEDEAALAALGGARGYNRCGVCVGTARRCGAALWRSQWAVARGSCLLAAAPAQLRVVRDLDAVTCDDVARKRYNGPYGPEVRSVVSRLPHPSGKHDLVLLPLNRPFTYVDNLANTSAVDRALKIVEPWMKIDMNSYQVAGVSAYTRAMISTPLRMMFTTILLPTFSFLAFFMFVIFCTGREPIPYQSLDEKSESNLGV